MTRAVSSTADKLELFRSKLAQEVLVTLEFPTLISHIASTISQVWGVAGVSVALLDNNRELKRYRPYGEPSTEPPVGIQRPLEQMLLKETPGHARLWAFWGGQLF